MSSSQRSAFELLDQLRNEISTLTRERNLFKLQRDDLNQKLQRQIAEMDVMKQAMGQIERAQQMLSKRSGINVPQVAHQQKPVGGNANGGANSQMGVGNNMNTNNTNMNPNIPNHSGAVAPSFPRLPQPPPHQRPTNMNTDNNNMNSNNSINNNNNNASNNTLQGANVSGNNQSTGGAGGVAGNGKPVLSAATSAAIAAAAAGEWSAQYDEANGSGRALEIDLAHTLQHESIVCAVAFSGDGRLLATGCNRAIRLFDTSTYENVQTVPMQHISAGSTAETALAAANAAGAATGDVFVRAVGFSPDSRYVAGGAENNAVGVWDVEERRIVATLTGHEVDIFAVQWSHDGQFIVTGSGDKTAKVWNWATQSCVQTFGGSSPDGPQDGVTSVAVSPDLSVVAVASLDRIIRLWDVSTGTLKSRMEGHDDSVYSIAFSPDGKTLASGSLDKSLRLWDVSNESCRLTLKGHRDYVLSVAFLPPHSGSEWLVSGSKDRTVNFWDVRLTSPLAVLYGHKNSVISVAVHPKRTVIASGSGDCRARLWPYSMAH